MSTISKECRDYNDGVEYATNEALKSTDLPNMSDILADFRKYLAEVEASEFDEDDVPF